MANKSEWTDKTSFWRVEKDKLLAAFAEGVASGDYEKIPYTRWRELSRAKNPYFIIFKSHDGVNEFCGIKTTYKIYFVGADGNENCYEALAGDCSLGSFLSWNFYSPDLSYDYDEEESNEMPDTYNDQFNYRTYINGASSGDHTTVTQYGTTTTAGTTISGGDYYSNTITTDPSYLGNSWVAISNETLKENDVRKICEEIINKNKEKEKMDTSKIFNFDFGPVSGSQFRMSPYGLAVRTQANGWIAFNAASGELMDVDVVNFDLSKMIYKMPVAQNAVATGDILIHGGKPVFVRKADTGNGTVNVIDYATASVMDILPVKSPFGFNFFTKVVCLVDMNGMSAASPENPFGGLLPFLMLGEGKDFDPMMLMFMGGSNFTNNPMMMYLLMNQKDKDDMLPFFLMANGGLSSAWCVPGRETPASATSTEKASI